MLAKCPGFTVVTVLALAFGIAINTAIFTAFNAVAFRSMQATEPDRIVNIYRSTLQGRWGQSFNYPDYVYYRDQNSAFSGLIAATGTTVSLSDLPSAAQSAVPASGGITALAGFRFFQQMAGSAELASGALISENYFSVLGVNPSQ